MVRGMHFITSVVLSLALLACSGGIQGLSTGGSLDSPAGSSSLGDAASANQAAPMQVSGSTSPNFDPNDLEREAYYHFSLSDSFAMKLPGDAEGQVLLAGTLKRFPTIQEEPRYIKLLDRRSNQYLVAELVAEEGKAGIYRFKATLPAASLSFEDIFVQKNKMLSFFISPKTQIFEPIGEEKPCETANCLVAGEPWYLLTPDAVEGNGALQIKPIFTGEENKTETIQLHDLSVEDDNVEGPIKIPGSK